MTLPFKAFPQKTLLQTFWQISSFIRKSQIRIFESILEDYEYHTHFFSWHGFTCNNIKQIVHEIKENIYFIFLLQTQPNRPAIK